MNYTFETRENPILACMTIIYMPFSDTAGHVRITGTHKKASKYVTLDFEISECTSKQMINDTIDSTIEDHFGEYYTYEIVKDQGEKLQTELDAYCDTVAESLPQ